MLSVAVAVSMHTHILVTTYYLCACQTKCSPMKHVKFVKNTHACVTKVYKGISCQPKIHAVSASHDAHSSSLMCTHVQLTSIICHQSFMHTLALLQAFSETCQVM